MPYARTNFTETLIRKRVKEIAAYGPTYRSFNRRDSSFSCKGTMRQRLRNKGKFRRERASHQGSSAVVIPRAAYFGDTVLYPLPLALPVAATLKITRGDSVQAEVRRLPTYQPQRLRRTRYNSGCPSIEVVPFGNPVLANFRFYQYRSPFDRRPAEETERTETRGRGCGAAGRVATTASAPSFPSTRTTTTIVRKISRKCVLFCR